MWFDLRYLKVGEKEEKKEEEKEKEKEGEKEGEKEKEKEKEKEEEFKYSSDCSILPSSCSLTAFPLYGKEGGGGGGGGGGGEGKEKGKEKQKVLLDFGNVLCVLW